MMVNIYPTDVPAATPETTVTPASRVNFGTSWNFDFTAGDFVTTATGQGVPTQGVQAWTDWGLKALLTLRYKYPVYSRIYGQDFDDLIRRNLTRAANESEIQRIVTETLMVDPRTAKVDAFAFAWDGATCYFTCQITSVKAETATILSEVTMS
jgi:hypothetical protein